MTILVIVGLSIIIYEFVFPVLGAISVYLQNMLIISQQKKQKEAGLLEQTEEHSEPEEYVNAIGFHIDSQEEYDEDEEGDYDDG